MRKLYFHLHGTTDIPFLSVPKVVKYFASFQHPDLFTASTVPSCIPLKDAPLSAQNFSPLYADITESDRFYYQWSGGLGESYWETAAEDLVQKIEDMLKQEIKDHEPVEINLLAHSHGGQIARLAAEKLQKHKNITFKITTVCTPLSLSPPIIMPDNVKNWHHFYDEGDLFAYVGSLLWQGLLSKSPVTRKIEDVIAAHPKGKLRCISKLDWHSHQVRQSRDPHNNALRKPTADYICQTVAHATTGSGGQKRARPDESDTSGPAKKRPRKD